MTEENAVALRTDALSRSYTHRAGSRLALEPPAVPGRAPARAYAEFKAALDWALAALLLVVTVLAAFGIYDLVIPPGPRA